MRRETKAERAAWSEYFGDKVAQASKYSSEKQGKYASKHEAKVAADLQALSDRRIIQDLKEQVRFVLVPGDGKLRPIVYVADFTWRENGAQVVGDAKGFKTPVYRLKKRMMKLLLGIDVREL